MRLQYVWIGEYRRLKELSVSIPYTEDDSVIPQLYGNLGLTLIAGLNGSGKTSLLSFVAQVFHNYQRFPERIKGSFGIAYRTSSGDLCLLYRQTEFGPISLYVPEEFDVIISTNGAQNAGVTRETEPILPTFERYLPTTVIVSAFSLHGEYPIPRPSNFLGDRRVSSYDIKNLYGSNHYSFPSFSGAIARLMSAALRQAPEIDVLQQLLGGKFTGDVLWRKREFDSDDLGEWSKYSDSLEYAEKNGDLYLNDFRLLKEDGSFLTLGNMSSGQKILLIRLLSVLADLEDNALVILEEPEMHLDPAWARQLISVLLSFFKNYDAHFIIATHSFSLLNAVPSDCVLIARDGEFSAPDFPTLLANESALAEHFYHAQPHYVEEQILRFAETATREELSRVFSLLGESSARYDVFKRLNLNPAEQNNAQGD